MDTFLLVFFIVVYILSALSIFINLHKRGMLELESVGMVNFWIYIAGTFLPLVNTLLVFLSTIDPNLYSEK